MCLMSCLPGATPGGFFQATYSSLSCLLLWPDCSLISFFLDRFVVVQSFSRVRLFVTSWTAARQASLSFTISQSWLRLMSTESVMPPNHLLLCHPLLLLPSVFPSIRVFSIEWVLLIKWPKYWSFSISPSNEYSWLISISIDWFDLLVVQGTLKSLPLRHLNLCPLG